MGFSPAQARSALVKTPSGNDVEAALELLLAEQNGRAGGSEADEDQMERETARREEAERERRRRRRAGPSRDSVKVTSREELLDNENLSEADKILAQASEIGQTVFNKASMLWNSSKEKAMKVYEEQKRALEAGEATKGRNDRSIKSGRPKWMAEVGENGEENTWPEEKGGGGFRDDQEVSSPRRSIDVGSSKLNGNHPRAESSTKLNHSMAAVEEKPYRSVKERASLLLADDPKPYVSPARHRKAAAPLPSSLPSASPSASPSVILFSRRLVAAEPSQIRSSSALKTQGNDHFKLGRFPEAETAYTSAISALPPGNLYLVPLYNNRAATRLKLGESALATDDCTVVVEMIGPSYNPANEAALPKDIAAEVNLADALVKAMIKRAQAWEMREKWKMALEDWEKVMAFGSSLLGVTAGSTRNLAAEGLRRSKRMIEEPSTSVTTKTTAKTMTRPSAPPPKPIDLTKSQAVTEMRKANRAADAEEEQRLGLKDSVEAKLFAWKGGKETNLRALVASLDTVLWDEVLAGGLKVGMRELITEKQVKIKYMKVIARLHPDKVSSSG